MPMNLFHRRLCSSRKWAKAVEERLLPWALKDLDLGSDVLEIGPGYGATTRALVRDWAPARLTAVESDRRYAERLDRELGTPGGAPGGTPGGTPGGSPDGARKVDTDRTAPAPPRVHIVHGDGTELPFPDARFTAVVCFTMLHHVASPAAQDRLFAEARRVLRPGGLFAGCDSVTSRGFRLIHLGDTRVEVPPQTLPDRLRAVGFAEPQVSVSPAGGSFRFRARTATSTP